MSHETGRAQVHLLGRRGDRWVRATAVTFFAVLQLLPLVAVLGAWLGVGVVGTLALFLAAQLAVFVLTLRFLAPATVVIGGDGVTVGRGGQGRFVPWSALRRARVERGDLVLELTRGEHLRGWASDVAAARLVREAIDEARAQAAPSHRVSAAIEALDRHEESVEAWLAKLEGRAASSAVYRDGGLNQASLEAAMRDGASPTSRRLAAALLLTARGDEVGRSHVRIAAEDTADPQLRAGLESLLEGEHAAIAAARALRQRR
ncbi:MAG: PH domain-containing protein [Myxococcales bacterium]|nr:PH domain-containing protein [Myxococcales bacterium]